MTQEEKHLLLVDLCARLLYGVVGLYTWKCKESYNRELTGSLYDELQLSWSNTDDSQFLPYLRPMSSMTEEEKNEYKQKQTNYEFGYFDTYASIDWLNANHFDYRGLIPMGLALEALEGMYK